MACGCSQIPLDAGGVRELRCVAPYGCSLGTLGFREAGETYTLPCDVACELAGAYPHIFELVDSDETAVEVSDGE
jgi:hypothetical protein